MNKAMIIFFQMLRREYLVSLRQPAEVINPLLFFLIVMVLFPLSLSPDQQLLTLIAPGLIWLAALLSGLLSLDRLFLQDFQNGCLEQMAIQPGSLLVPVVAKVIVHWSLTALPLILITPLLALMLHLPSNEMLALLLSLFLGTPVLSLLGALGCALTLPQGTQGLLLSLLILPLAVPVLIFGAGSVSLVTQGMNAAPLLLLLMAMSILSISLLPWAISCAIRISLD